MSDIADELLQRWKRGERPNLNDILARAGSVPPDDLLALLRVDQQQRWLTGDRVPAETYLRAHPTFAADIDRAAALIHHELVLRQTHGESPSLEEYTERFPVHAGPLRRRHQTQEPELPPTIAPDTVPPTLPPTAAEASTPHLFPGYQILRELGRGGMGIVYAAREERTGQTVALKAMQHLDPALLLRFKQEFRHLAGVKHPNLITLYKLEAGGADWFYTMELLDGVGFADHVRGPEGPRTPPSPAQTDRLRSALVQLADGLETLHRASIIHRDLKPGNVLVTPQGRVVILDFGLAAEIDRGGAHMSLQPRLLGTIYYMAPEQAACQPVSPASDWYAAGVMLFEVLTGRFPFQGPPLQVLQDKQRSSAPDPRTLVPGLPDDLAELCLKLLAREPHARPGGTEVRTVLGEISCPLTPPPVPEVHLVGRHDHLAALADAYQRARAGRAVVVTVAGRSGSGKSALVRHFLDDVSRQGEAVVLFGRCYEQEAVPYKGLDNLVDALVRYLESIPAAQVEAILPRDVGPLARVFPVLGSLDSPSARRGPELSEPQELRRRALAGLRELFARLGDRRPLILAIDDLQWGDEDSVAVLADLLAPPDPPVLLLICVYRGEEAETCPPLVAFRRLAGPERACDWIDLAVPPLSELERRELAEALLAGAGPEAAASAELIARQSAGFPFFVHELARHLRSGGAFDSAVAEILTLEDVLWMRVLRLPPAARRLLEVVAIAGRPLAQAEGCTAAAVGDDAPEALATLRAERLIRGAAGASGEHVETYHDRIRETIARRLKPEARAGHHRRLAEVLDAAGADPEWRAGHWLGADEPARAGSLFALAADRAAAALAFDRAARLYRQALEYGAGLDSAEMVRLRVGLGDSLARAGQAAAAAREFQSLAQDSESSQALELRRRAALLFLSSGHIDLGMAALREVLASAGLSLCGSPRVSFWSLLWRRLLLRLRGLKYRMRKAEEVPADLLARLDVCDTAAAGLSMVDTVQGAYFQSRALLLALDAGEPGRLVRALALEGGHESIGGAFNVARTETLLKAAEALAAVTGEPYAHGVVALARGVAAALLGEWAAAVEHCTRSETILRERCSGVSWELGTVHRFTLWPLMYQGEIAEVTRRLPGLIKQARDNDDLYEETNLCLVVRTFLRLAADEPARARQELDTLMARWSREGFHVQHMDAVLDEVQIALYEGDGPLAWRRLTENWRLIERALFLQVQQVRITLTHLRGRAALACAASQADESMLRSATRDAKTLGRERVPWAMALGKLLEAGIAARRGGPTADLLADAAERCESASLGLHAACARWLRGRLLGGVDGRRLTELAEAYLRAQKVVRPDRMSMLLVPGVQVTPLAGDPSCVA